MKPPLEHELSNAQAETGRAGRRGGRHPKTASHGRISGRNEAPRDAAATIHHFSPQRLPLFLSFLSVSQVPPAPAPDSHSRRAIQYVGAMALSIPSAQGAEQGKSRARGARRGGKHREKQTRVSSGGESALLRRVFLGHYRLTGTVSFLFSLFFSLAAPPLLLYLGVKEPALRQRRADWSPLVHVIRD